MKKLLLENKKGSHVGMILSFVIFVTFLVFLYSALEPAIKTQKEKDSLLDFLEVEIVNNVTKDLTVSIVNFTLDSLITGKIQFLAVNGVAGKRVLVKEGGGIIDSGWVDTQNIYMEAPSSGKILKVFYLDESNENIPDLGTSLSEGADYQILITKTTEYIYESAINETIENYNAGHVIDMKNQFNIPEGINFGIIFRNYKGEEIETSAEEILTEVYSREINIIYLDSEAVERAGVLIIRIW